MIRSANRTIGAVLVLAVIACLSSHVGAETRTVARCGDGFLEEIDGYPVLHVKGSPYEMGYQHGALLKADIRALVRYLLDVKAKEFADQLQFKIVGIGIKPDPKAIIAMIARTQKPYVPERYYEEMQGVADGSGLPLDEIVACNFIPELFHCSGFALSGSATKDGTLYHGRVLDYGCDWRLARACGADRCRAGRSNSVPQLDVCRVHRQRVWDESRAGLDR